MTRINVKDSNGMLRFEINGVRIVLETIGQNAGKLCMRENPGADNMEWIKANKEEIIEFIKKTEDDYHNARAEDKAAKIGFYTTGWESHEVYIDTREDIDEQIANIAARYPNDCTVDSVKADYEKTVAQKVENEAAAEGKQIEALKKNIETAEKSGRVYATQKEANEARRKYNNLYNEGGDGFVPRFYTQDEVNDWKNRLTALTARKQKRGKS